MLTDQQIYLCSQFTNKIEPVSQKVQLGGVPKNMERISNDRFLICDPCVQSKKTRLVEMRVRRKDQENNQLVIQQSRLLEEFEGVWTSWDFDHDNYALLINKEGDFLFYNLNNKSIQEAQKQHPGLYYDAHIMHTNEHFVTCGGSFKNQISNATERIIKVWGIDNSDCLVQKSRINTGHDKSIEHSFLINKSSVVSLSSDKSVRVTNLLTEQLTSIIQTDVELLSGCQIDCNTILAGGNSKNIKIFDLRARRALSMNPKINETLVHVVNFTRFTARHVLVSNINNLGSIDLRNWQIVELGTYNQGEINSEILTLNSSEFVVGNREKSMQAWRAS